MTEPAPLSMSGRIGAVVVTYRRLPTLLQTIDHIRAQTRPPGHVVIVDNDGDARVRAAPEGGDLHVDDLGLP